MSRHLASVVLVALTAVRALAHDDWRDSLPPALQDKVQTRHQKDIQSDIELGRKYAEEVRKEIPASENIEFIDRVQRIGREFAKIANETPVEVTWGDKRLNPFPYEFTVLKGDEVNAFSIPGGFVYIYEGLLDFCESDDELAGVMAHEIAHASFRHVATLRSQQSKFDIINIPLIIAAILSGSQDAAAITQGVGLVNQAVASGWSVNAEEAADYGGVQYMRASRFNSVGLLTFMERLALRDRSRPAIDWGIYRTHPPSGERARSLMARLRDANIPILRSKVTVSLSARVLPGDDGEINLWFGKTRLHGFRGVDALTRADSAARALDRFFDAVPALYELSLRDSALYGRDAPLFAVLPEDGENGPARARIAFDSLKKLLFDLNYRLWPQAERASVDPRGH